MSSILRQWRALSLALAMTIFAVFNAAAQVPPAAPVNNDFVKSLNDTKQFANSSKLSTKNVFEIAVTVIKFILLLASSIALIALISGGVMYMLSAGDENKAAQAKNVIIYTVIGLLLMGFAVLIVNTVIEKLIGGTPPAASP